MDNQEKNKRWIKYVNVAFLIFTIFMIWLVGKEAEPLVTGEEAYKQYKNNDN